MLTDDPLHLRPWTVKSSGVRMIAIRRGGRSGRVFVISAREAVELANMLIDEVETNGE